MMTRVTRAAFQCLLGGVCLLLCSASRFEPSPAMKEQSLPEPPMQRAAWSPPKAAESTKADLPAELLSATARLFEQGMADPRGCEYREVAVGTGSCWSGDGGVIHCHGWVLPAAAPAAPAANAGGQAFAVCWNGLVYPAVSVGAKADLEADVRAMIQHDQETVAGYVRARPDFPFHRFGSGCPAEGEAVSEKTVLPVKVCLLLRLGQGDLAARFWKEWEDPVGGANAPKPGATTRPAAGPAAGGGRDPYPVLSDALLWAHFDRCVCAHMRGDDRLALVSAKALGGLRKLVEDEAAARKIDKNQSNASYLDVVPELLKDAERRVAEGPRTPALKRGEKAFANKAAWVAALVADLDQVSARQNGQPGGVDLGWDPIVQALVACGDDAVEPLLDCLEHDGRLTRSVHFWRDFSPTRMPIGVPEAAYVALSGILQTSFFSTGSTGDDLSAHGQEGRAKVAATVRAYWNKYKGMSLPERWFSILADDNAGAEQWLQAMGNITRPVDVGVTPGSMFGTGWVRVPHRAPGERPKLSGESLRAKKNPSLVDLAAKRIEQIDQADEAAEASGMAIELSQWDPEASLPVLRRQLDFCVGRSANHSFGAFGDVLLPRVAQLATTMAKAGDRSGLKPYGDWVRSLHPDKIGPSPYDVLAPLWEYQDDPAIAATAEAMFNGRDPDWNPLLPHVITGWGHESLLSSPLLGLKPFRDQMLRGLADQSTYATLTMREGREAEMKFGGGRSNRLTVPTGETAAVPVGTKMTVRTCDKYAYQISECAGAPCIQFYWPQAQRDAAVKACAEFLTRFGENLRYTRQFDFEGDSPFHETAHLAFPPLDHPATAQEAKEAKAIFSLEDEAGGAGRRLFKLPKVPMKAKWVTLKKYPFDQQYYDPVKGETGISHTFYQGCRVWQAEEVEVGGQWRRYFGVVGPHEVAKVPAEEIEFEGGWPWFPLSGGVDCRIEGPGSERRGEKVTVTALTPKSPLVVRLTLRNRLGVAQSLPTKYVEKAEGAEGAEGGGLAVRPGVKLSLRRLPDDERERMSYAPDAGTAVPAKPLVPLGADLAGQKKTVESTDEFLACQFDLHDGFDVTQPGRYQLQVSFTKESGVGEGQPMPVDFDLVEPAK